ncbi:pyridoxamine 5'-phosphate oxidase family protein [Pseudonocardia xishanensis]|uniref:Pyridoxamine 5'-phosphate oxidase family protein n=1 Tax=Pseudonocardia xishanensis TaxID=630995 RepID=A0ABP8RWJ5_9PSEU
MPVDDDHVRPTDRTTLRRFNTRGVYDLETINGILDEGLICHLGFVEKRGWPLVIPTAYVRVGRDVYVHGSAASRTMRTLSDGVDVCVSVTLTDGIVLARTAFNHSFNYRSVIIMGRATPVTDPEERLVALKVLTEGLVPGRWSDVRAPTASEIKASALLKIPIDEASVKLRSGPPGDEGEDLEWDTWAGVIPIETLYRPAETDPKLPQEYPIPDYVKAYRRPQ